PQQFAKEMEQQQQAAMMAQKTEVGFDTEGKVTKSQVDSQGRLQLQGLKGQGDMQIQKMKSFTDLAIAGIEADVTKETANAKSAQTSS
ncbi:unnamed protein product, partial [marine sediment metagenome]